jgi:hypothetical protein
MLKIGKYKVSIIPYYEKLTENQRKILGIGKKQPGRVISPEQAIWDKRCAEFDVLPNCQVICDKMKVFILDDLSDEQAIQNIQTEFGVEKDFLEYFYPIAKKNILDKKQVGLI